MNKILTILVLLFAFNAFAQKDNTLKEANNNFNIGNFNDALKGYLTVIKDNPDDVKINYRIGVCYLNSNIDKSEAIPYLEKAIKDEDANPNTAYLLGRAYHFAYRFNDAIKMYQQFKKQSKGTNFNINDVEHQIEYCYNAIELMKFPLDVEFDNLGIKINSEYPDYYPFVPIDESFLMFNSKRDDGSEKLPNNQFFSEVYVSKVKNGVYTTAKKVDQNINTLNGNEEVIGMSSNGKYVLFYFDNDENYGDIFIAEYDGISVSNLEKLPKVVNSKSHEIAATINTDGNVIYFASDREDGYGGVDIYMSRKLPNGKWGPAQNLGPTINTDRDEDFPNLSPDGKALYFSSKGHTSMGGYDIFKADWNNTKKTWTAVKNVGYPINTPEDNMNFRISENGRTGYISALREGGYGDLDVYAVTFNEVDPNYTVVKGYVTSTDTTKKIKDVFLSVIDKQTDEIYGDYLTNPVTGRYIMILPPGNYNLLVEVPGFEIHTEDISILGKGSYRAEIKKNIALKPE